MSPFESRLRRNYLIYTAGFFGFVSLLAVGILRPVAESHRARFSVRDDRHLCGHRVMSRTADVSEYYVAGGAFLRCSMAWPWRRTG